MNSMSILKTLVAVSLLFVARANDSREAAIRHLLYLPKTLTIGGDDQVTRQINDASTDVKKFQQLSRTSYGIMKRFGKKNKTKDDVREIYEELRRSAFYDINGVLKRACNITFTRNPEYRKNMQALIKSMGISFIDLNGPAAFVFSMHLAQIISYSQSQPWSKAQAYFRRELDSFVRPGGVYISRGTFERWEKIIFTNYPNTTKTQDHGRRLPGRRLPAPPLPDWFPGKVTWNDVTYIDEDIAPMSLDASLFSSESSVVINGESSIESFEASIEESEKELARLLKQMDEVNGVRDEIKKELQGKWTRLRKLKEQENPGKEVQAEIEQLETEEIPELEQQTKDAMRPLQSLSKKYGDLKKSIQTARENLEKLQEDAESGDQFVEEFEEKIPEEQLETEEVDALIAEGRQEVRIVAQEVEVGMLEVEMGAAIEALAAIALEIIALVIMLLRMFIVGISSSGLIVNRSPVLMTSCLSQSSGSINAKFLRKIETPIDQAEVVGFMNYAGNNTWQYQGFFKTTNVASYTALGMANPIAGSIGIKGICYARNDTKSVNVPFSMTNYYSKGHYRSRCSARGTDIGCSANCIAHGDAAAMVSVSYFKTIPLPPAPQKPTNITPPICSYFGEACKFDLPSCCDNLLCTEVNTNNTCQQNSSSCKCH
mmetsp:Transcript_30398/g.48564  ORF Transcript_30398/g.48564 Transcript_30398/m.48564 type:complete len:657 (+) Transcript_30398:3693-5663(+)